MKISEKLAAKAACASKKMNGDSQLIVVLVLIIVAIFYQGLDEQNLRFCQLSC